MTDAGNQQERLRTVGWVVGIVDGEGCFYVAIQRCRVVKLGWQVFPEFVVTQGAKSVSVLHILRDFFGCGRLTAKGPNSSVMTYSVYGVDLERVIIPFFDRYPLISRKLEDFLKFREIVRLVRRKEHRTERGFRRVVELAFSMNQRGKQRKYRIEDVLAKPSETARRATQLFELG